MLDIAPIQKAIREERLDGWLFANFAHRDRLTDSILGLSSDAGSTRRWFLYVPADGLPVKIVNTLENAILDGIVGTAKCYYARSELEALLAQYSGQRVAILSDPTIQVLSTVDASTADLARSAGMITVSAASLVQRIRGVLDAKGIESHERAAKVLYSIIQTTWAFVENSFRQGVTLTESSVRDHMLKGLADAGLRADHAPIVASGSNAGNPHYDIKGVGRTLERDEILQFDIWAKEPDGIYADISWVGFTGSSVPERARSRFSALCAARDLVYPALDAALSANSPITGADIDRLVRSFLLVRFPPSALRHRTGHGIDTECHGVGVNLDSVEFPDSRGFLEGSCFSVEPGIYFEDEGYRTEIDIYIRGGKPVVSGGNRQRTLLTFQDQKV